MSEAVLLGDALCHLSCVPQSESQEQLDRVTNIEADEICVVCGGGFTDEDDDTPDVPTEDVQGP